MVLLLNVPIVDCTPTPDGRDYVGHISVTESGRTCQAWTSQSPHTHQFDQDNTFADGSVAAAVNYCRYVVSGLWCYTTDPDVRWEYCNVPLCGQPSVKKQKKYSGNFKI